MESQNLSTDDSWKRPYYSVAAPVLATIAVCAVCLNVYVLCSAIYLKRSASINLWFSLSLAATDAYSAMMIVTNLFLQSYFPYVLLISPNKCLLIVAEMLRLGGLVSSVLHLLALAWTHFLGVLYPLRQYAWMTQKSRKVTLVAMLWVLPPSGFFVYMSSVPEQAFLSPDCQLLTFNDQPPFRLTVCLSVVTPMLVTFLLYLGICRRLRANDRDPMLKDLRPTRHNKKLFGTMLLLMGTFVLGWFPSVVLYALYCNGCPFSLQRLDAGIVAASAICVQLLIILKLFSNPLIYAMRISELRYALRQVNRQLFGLEVLNFNLTTTAASQPTAQQQQQQLKIGWQHQHQIDNQNRSGFRQSISAPQFDCRREKRGSLPIPSTRSVNAEIVFSRL